MAYPDGAAQVFSEVTRFTVLDVNGYPAVGANVFVTNQLLKATFTPVMETGVDLVTLNANGDIASHFKHGDMPKYYTMQVEVATPDPILHAMLCGGTVISDTTTALGTPTGTLLATAQTTLGTLAAATYGYRVSQYNQYGESLAMAEVTGTVASGSTGTVVVSGAVPAAGALGLRVYGRTPGGEQLLGTIPNFTSQATSAISGTGSVSSLTVTALTKAIPAGATFTISGDTNSPKIVFTCLTTAGVGATAVNVSPSQSVTTTIAAGAIVPSFVDNGSATPAGSLPGSDTTAGPGTDTGYQAPALGIVGNVNGVSMEFWGKAVVNGTQASVLPYYRWVVPGVKNLHEEARTFDPSLQSNMYTGQAFENPNWGSGPFADWTYDSSKVFQYARAGRTTLPTAGLSPIAATA